MKEFNTEVPKIQSQNQIKRYYRNNLASHAFNNTKAQANTKTFRDSRIRQSSLKSNMNIPTTMQNLANLPIETHRENKPKNLNEVIMDFNSVTLPPDLQTHISKEPIKSLNNIPDPNPNYYSTHVEVQEKKPLGSIGSSIKISEPKPDFQPNLGSILSTPKEKEIAEKKPITSTSQNDLDRAPKVENTNQYNDIDLLGLSPEEYSKLESKKTPTEGTFKSTFFV